MGFVVTGAMNKEIAEKIGSTERTVKFHRHQIMKKMQAGSLAELVRIAEKLEEIKPILTIELSPPSICSLTTDWNPLR